MTTLIGWWAAIWPNLAAAAIWGTPAFLTHHVLIRRHVDRRHHELTQHVANTRRE